MLKTLEQWMTRGASTTRAAGLLLAAWVMLAANPLALPWGLLCRVEMPGGVGQLLDSRFYAPDEAMWVLNGISEPCQQAYIRFLLSWDALLPLVYGLGLAMALILLRPPATGVLKYAPWLPLLAAGTDYAENGLWLLMLWQYPDASGWASALSPWATLVKWVLLAAVMGLGGWLGWRRWAGKPAPSPKQGATTTPKVKKTIKKSPKAALKEAVKETTE
ncbi:MAG: hypothetical protein OEV94_05230 [Deltaproteobacteria bacterium]|nr:hypothetical protein [Deltaproteobacteria bacterium]